MKIEQAFPPNIEKIKVVFPNLPPGVIFAYGDTIYSPRTADIPDHLIVHESVHKAQQFKNPNGPDGWWDEYLRDEAFRLSQEVEAYRAQWQFLEKNYNRGERRRILKAITHDLAGPIYGRIVTKDQAKQLITDK